MQQIRTRTGIEAKAAVTYAALELIRSEGIEALSLARVAQRIGVTKAAVYHHFKTKDAIVHFALAAVLDKFRAIIVAPLSVNKRADRIIDLAISNPEIRALCAAADASPLKSVPLTDSALVRTELVSALTRAQWDADTANVRVNSFLAALSAAVVTCRTPGQIDSMRAALKGLLAPDAQSVRARRKPR